MKIDDIGRRAVVIISDDETAVGRITEINTEHGTFRLVTDNGREYQFTERKVIIKFKEGR